VFGQFKDGLVQFKRDAACTLHMAQNPIQTIAGAYEGAMTAKVVCGGLS
jgi:hypothetical protein